MSLYKIGTACASALVGSSALFGSSSIMSVTNCASDKDKYFDPDALERGAKVRDCLTLKSRGDSWVYYSVSLRIDLYQCI